jgi:hypothetical protein
VDQVCPTVDGFFDLLDRVPGVHLAELPPLTTLLVWTWNSVYRVMATADSHVYVQGGAYFPNAMLAYVDGASFGGSLMKMGWIGVGLKVEFRVGTRRIVTSPVLRIIIEPSDISVVH